MAKTNLYALDFDGVICDSAIETGITGWKVASHIWQDMPPQPDEQAVNNFRIVRPVMETGYEAVLIMRLLFQGVSPSDLLANFADKINTIICDESLSINSLKQQFGETRDHWIKNDLNEWIKMNPLFDGIANKLRSLASDQMYIITTKQERFVDQILKENSIAFPVDRIFGLDRNMSKTEILAALLTEHKHQTILFIEDRLPTLHNVINDKNLEAIKLYFANWGYNTEQDKKEALADKAITTIDLDNFIHL